MGLFKKNQTGVQGRADAVVKFEDELDRLQLQRKGLLASLFESSDNGDQERVAELKEKISILDRDLDITRDGIERANQRLLDAITEEVDSERKSLPAEIEKYSKDFNATQRAAVESLAEAAFLSEETQFRSAKQIKEGAWSGLAEVYAGRAEGTEKVLLNIFKQKFSDLRANVGVSLSERRNLIQQNQGAFSNPSNMQCYVNKIKIRALKSARGEEV